MHSGQSTIVRSISYRGGITRAFDDVNNDTSILPGVELKYILANADCNSQMGVGAAVDLFNANVKAFIGPPCSKSCLSAGLLSTNKKIPMVSFSCSSLELSNKDNYPYFARTKPFARAGRWAPKAFSTLVDYFKWKRMCVIERLHEIYSPLAEETMKEFRSRNYTVIRRQYVSEDYSFVLYGELLKSLETECRGN